MEDSSWYEVDYGYVEPFEWGKGEGCSWFLSFVLPCWLFRLWLPLQTMAKDIAHKQTDECFVNQVNTWPQYYCDGTSDNGCTHDHVGVSLYKQLNPPSYSPCAQNNKKRNKRERVVWFMIITVVSRQDFNTSRIRIREELSRVSFAHGEILIVIGHHVGRKKIV